MEDMPVLFKKSDEKRESVSGIKFMRTAGYVLLHNKNILE
jgi:hypothetical protein